MATEHWLTNSRDVIARLKSDEWVLDRVRGSHHHYKKAGVPFIVTVPHPKKDLALGLVKSIYAKAGWPHPGAKR
jgi:predicted RNA binding protein YcfA (HicA-like mRNA interferase family)